MPADNSKLLCYKFFDLDFWKINFLFFLEILWIEHVFIMVFFLRWRSIMEGECSEGAEGWLLVRVHVPELNVQKSLQFPRDQLIWDVKQQCLAALPKVC